MIHRYILVLLMCFSLCWQQVDAQDDLIDTLLSSMTLEHKVAQLFMVSMYGESLTYVGQEMLQTWQPGGVVLFPSNINTPAQITQLTNSYQQTITEAGGIPLFIAVDQEGGWIARLRDGFTEWPPMSLLTAANDPALAYDVGRAMALELRAVGINMNLAPVADLDTNLDNPIIGRRSPGSEPELVSVMLQGYIAGSQEAGVMTTTKHFPGHGDTGEDSHVTLPVIYHDLTRLESMELRPFAAAIEAQTGAIMVAHIWFPAFDPEPLPASLSHNIVTGILRDTMGYDGLIITDALDMDAIDTIYTDEEAALMAINAGVDMLVYSPGISEVRQMAVMQFLVDAVRSGELDEARIDDSVRRILHAKMRYGVMNWLPLEPDTVEERIDLSGNLALVERMFRAGVTVAFDHHDLLPIDAEQSVAIIYPGQRISIQRVCGTYRDDIHWLSIPDSPSEADIQAAERVASLVDVVIVFTRNVDEHVNVPPLVRALPQQKTVAVALRSPYDLLAYPDVSGYIVTYGPQDPAITTTCGVLFGEYDALGTLAVDLDR
ncbi:MAG: beta-N-acetylhexosaminidase [Phototrophicales bacterium]